MNRANKDKLLYGVIGLSAAITVGLLVWIIGFVFLNGFKLIDLDFITSDFDSKTQYVNVKVDEEYNLNKSGEKYPVKKGDIIRKMNSENIENYKLEELDGFINGAEESILTLKVTRPGEGIFPMLVTTLEIILVSLLIACPIGIFAAVYLTEYAKQGRLVKIIRFAWLAP
jgi:phosphate transport system permease protein